MSPVLLQSVPLIGMPNSYAVGATGAGQAVAVIDTGVQSNHEFLSGKVVMEACFSNSGGGGGAVALCPNGLSTQTGGGAADSTTAQCINAVLWRNCHKHCSTMTWLAAFLYPISSQARVRSPSRGSRWRFWITFYWCWHQHRHFAA
jgi:hypothetical protein